MRNWSGRRDSTPTLARTLSQLIDLVEHEVSRRATMRRTVPRMTRNLRNPLRLQSVAEPFNGRSAGSVARTYGFEALASASCGGKFGHDFGAIAKRAGDLGLFSEDEDRVVLELMAGTDAVIRSRCIRTGKSTIPHADALHRTCRSLNRSVGEALLRDDTPQRSTAGKTLSPPSSPKPCSSYQ
jgi:hypothetical protein